MNVLVPFFGTEGQRVSGRVGRLAAAIAVALYAGGTSSALAAKPDAPTGLAAAAVVKGEVTLSWVDNSDDESGFVIQRQERNGKWHPIAQVGPDVTTYADTSVKTDRSYAYRVRATRDGGKPSAFSNEASVDVVATRGAVTYASGVFDQGAAEISAYDPASRRLFVINASAGTVDILDAAVKGQLTHLGTIDAGGGINSVAARHGRIAVAVQADDKVSHGMVKLYNADGELQAGYEVGALPDMLTFTPDGAKILVANEGEPSDDYAVDPEGSVSIIDLTAGSVATVGFGAYNDRRHSLLNKGVRVFGVNAVGADASVAEDLEPEYIAVSPDGATAYVTLQENNALAVIDIASATLKDIVALGYKDHGHGQPHLMTFPVVDRPLLGTTPAGQEILLGGFSGLWYTGVDGRGRSTFVTVPDRGPNGEPTDVDQDGNAERPFALPEYQARVVHLALDPRRGEVKITGQTLLTYADGDPVTGLPNIPALDEEPVDLYGQPLPYDPMGADMEGIVVDRAGNYWMVDEYRPAIYKFSASGTLLARYVPQGTAALAGGEVGDYGSETLPAVYAKRRANRGFEAMALDSDNGVLYAFIQSPIENPDSSVTNKSDVIRMLAIDMTDGTPVAEYVYLLERNLYAGVGGRADKLGDAFFDQGRQRFYVVERDSGTTADATKSVFEVDLKGATNLLADGVTLLEGKTLEQHTADELAMAGVKPMHKQKVMDLASLGYLAGDKVEGLTLLPDGAMAILNDNDFGLEALPIASDGSVAMVAEPVPPTLGVVHFGGNTLDASDKDKRAHLQNWPVFGMYLPDSIYAYSVDGLTYVVTANEGDAREWGEFAEEARVKDLMLDPMVFPDAAMLQEDNAMGRLNVTTTMGDLDGDGDYDRLYAFGGRSFSIWDVNGHLVWDSGDQFERILADRHPDYFNVSNDDNDLDSRSDNKGPEPEGLTLGEVNGKTYAFIGLERDSGIMVYDIQDPRHPRFVTYLSQRDFTADPASGSAGDLGPEGLLFIPAEESPTGKPTLVVANEISGTTTAYTLNLP